VTHDRLRDRLAGVSFTTPTPFDGEDGRVLYDEVAGIVEPIIDAGGQSIIPCGNTGEFHSLTDAEHRGVVEATVDTAGSDTAVIGGVGGSTRQAVSQAEACADAGADGLLIHAPDHTYRHRQGVIEHYRRIAAATDLGVVLYKRGPSLPRRAIHELSTLENVVGVKFAVPDVDAFSTTVRETSGEVVFTTGLAERYAPAFALEGAAGFTTGVGNVFPSVPLALQAAIEVGDRERALAIRDLVRPYEEVRDGTGADNDTPAANNVPAIKHGLDTVGRYGGPVRPPLVDLGPSDRDRVAVACERIRTAEV
jgi:4-hydroxy-tetrahydrodipicolinate synthase